MRVTNFGQNTGLVSNAGSSGNTGSIGGVVVGPPPAGTGGGQAIISSGSNTASWQPVVSTITSNGSNVLLGPNVNFASGSNITFSVSSNTLFIHGQAGGGSGSFLETINGGGGAVKTHGAMGSTETINLGDGNYHTGTLDANCSITLTTIAGIAERWFTLKLTENSTGGWTPTFVGSGTIVRIDGSPAHDTTANTTTIYVGWTDDGGSTWYVGQLGADSSSFGTTASEVGGSSSAGAATTVSRSDHIHGGVVLITSNGSNALARPIVSIASGAGILTSVSSNTLTISTNLTHPVMEAAPHWELVMQDGVTAPPEPLENEARDDWIYGLVP